MIIEKDIFDKSAPNKKSSTTNINSKTNNQEEGGWGSYQESQDIS